MAEMKMRTWVLGAVMAIGLCFSAAASAREVVVEVDDSYHVDEPAGSAGYSARAQCSGALDSLGHNVKAGKHRLYKLAWQIKSQAAREDAAEVVHRITAPPSQARLLRASRCCSRMSDTRSIPSVSDFTCLSSALR